MKISIIFILILAISVQGCLHNLFPHKAQTVDDPEKKYFNYDFGGAIDPSGMGDWMDIRLNQSSNGTTDSWIVKGEGESYISSAPVKYKMKFIIQGDVSVNDPTRAKLNFYKYSEIEDGKVAQNYIVEATSDKKSFVFVLATQNGNVMTKGKLFQMNTLIGGS